MRNLSSFSITSHLYASQQDVWSFVSTMDGINFEFYPLLKMTVPQQTKNFIINNLSRAHQGGRGRGDDDDDTSYEEEDDDDNDDGDEEEDRNPGDMFSNQSSRHKGNEEEDAATIIQIFEDSNDLLRKTAASSNKENDDSDKNKNTGKGSVKKSKRGDKLATLSSSLKSALKKKIGPAVDDSPSRSHKKSASKDLFSPSDLNNTDSSASFRLDTISCSSENGNNNKNDNDSKDLGTKKAMPNSNGGKKTRINESKESKEAGIVGGLILPFDKIQLLDPSIISRLFSTDKAAFRSKLLLFTKIPIEYDDLFIVQSEQDRGFLESSSMMTQKHWRHSRKLKAVSIYDS